MNVACSMRRGVGLVLAVVALGAGGSVAASESVATMQVTGSAISWQPAGAYESVQLRLSGGNDNIFIEKTYPGTSLAFSTGELGDGSYSYELRARPQGAGALHDQKDAAEAAGQHDEVERLASELTDLYTSTATVQSGAFTVSDGWINDPSSDEGE